MSDYLGLQQMFGSETWTSRKYKNYDQPMNDISQTTF
jgi:hypothetical protein